MAMATRLYRRGRVYAGAMEAQAGILEGVPPVGRHLTFDLRSGSDPREALESLRQKLPASSVIGFGESLVRVLGWQAPGLRVFPGMAGQGVQAPSTQNALW